MNVQQIEFSQQGARQLEAAVRKAITSEQRQQTNTEGRPKSVPWIKDDRWAFIDDVGSLRWVMVTECGAVPKGWRSLWIEERG